MDDNLKHIDKFYRDSLADYVPENRNKFGWGKLGLKLLIFNFGGWTLFAASVMFIGVVGTIVYNANEIAEIFSPAPVKKSNNITIVKPLDVDSFQLNGAKQLDTRDQALSEIPEKDKEESNYQEETVQEPQSQKEYLNTINKDNSTPAITRKTNSNILANQNATFNKSSRMSVAPLAFKLNNTNQTQIKFEQNQSLTKLNPQSKFSDSLKNFGIKTRTVSMELYINPAFVYGKLSGSDLIEEHISNRNNNEDPILSLGFGADIKYSFNKWFVQTGLNFSQYGEKANYQLSKQVDDPDNLTESIDTIFRWIYDPPYFGEPFIVSVDTTWIPGQKTVYWQQSTSNRISYIEIPVLGGYEWNMNKVSIDVCTGVSIGFAISKKGGLPKASNSEFIQLGNINIAEPVFNYIFQVGVAIPFKERIKFLIKPNLKYNLNSIYDDKKYQVEQHYLSIGLKMGVIIDL